MKKFFTVAIVMMALAGIFASSAPAEPLKVGKTEMVMISAIEDTEIGAVKKVEQKLLQLKQALKNGENIRQVYFTNNATRLKGWALFRNLNKFGADRFTDEMSGSVILVFPNLNALKEFVKKEVKINQ